VPRRISEIAKRVPRKGTRAAAPSLPYEGWLIEQLKDPTEATDIPAPSFFLTQSPPLARVVKLVDTRDLKSLDG
jgi:hypothetical protein